MARASLNEAREMASKGGNFDFSFLSLKDREVKKVRFLYSNIDEVEAFTTHQITLADNKKRNVDCLRATNEPVQKCPLCAIGNKPRARIYLSLVDEVTHELLVWERSAQFLDELEGYFNRYGDLRDCVFEIERKGTGLDTKYNIYYIGQNIINDKSVLPERADVYGKLILTKTADELGAYINTGTLPDSTAPINNSELERRNVYTDPNVNPWGNNNQPQSTQAQPNTPKRNGWN